MKVVLTEQAEAEFERIGDNIASDNPMRAVSFVRELRQRCDGLADMSRAFPLVPRYEAFGVRRRVHGNYVILYRIGVDEIDVLHIVNAARDLDMLLLSAGE